MFKNARANGIEVFTLVQVKVWSWITNKYSKATFAYLEWCLHPIWMYVSYNCFMHFELIIGHWTYIKIMTNIWYWMQVRRWKTGYECVVLSVHRAIGVWTWNKTLSSAYKKFEGRILHKYETVAKAKGRTTLKWHFESVGLG